MKMPVRLLSLVLALLLAFSGAAFAEVDLSNMSLEELQQLQKNTNTAILTQQSERNIGNLSDADVGDYITFGTYEQDNKGSTENEPIEWLVLAKEDDKLLVISKHALDAIPFNLEDEGNTWDKSYIRRWLNYDFFNIAFTEEEQALIPRVTVTADRNPMSNQKPGWDMLDKVFLLSLPEVKKYMPTLKSRVCSLTAYAKGQGASTDNTTGFWLRTPGIYSYKTAYVSYEGNINSDGYFYYVNRFSVRPAMWINLIP